MANRKKQPARNTNQETTRNRQGTSSEAANRESNWNREGARTESGWSGQPNRSGSERNQQQGSPSQYRNPESDDWREGFRGGFGNSGQMSETAYQQGATGYGSGPHAGRGPRGYQRSDERVHEEVCDRLTEHGAIDASGIEVRIEQGEVILEGTVSDRRSKRLAEEIAEAARGVRDVHNRLRVSDTGSDESGRSFATSELEQEDAGRSRSTKPRR